MYKADDEKKKCKMASNKKLRTNYDYVRCLAIGIKNGRRKLFEQFNFFFLSEIKWELCNRAAQAIFYRF